VSIALTVIVVLTAKIAMTEQPHETGSSDLRASAEQRPVGPIECIPTAGIAGCLAMAATGSAQWRLAWVLGALVFGVADLVARKCRCRSKSVVIC